MAVTDQPASKNESISSNGDPDDSLAFAIACAKLLREDKCKNVVALDIRELSDVTDVVIIASGTSDRQMNSSLDDLEELGEESGRTAFRTSKDDRSTWLLADFVDVIVHLFEPSTRAYYDLEMLWGDAKRIAWRGPGAVGEDDESPDSEGSGDGQQGNDA